MRTNTSTVVYSEEVTPAIIRALLITQFTLATALAAQIRIPLPGTIVPMTFQTAVVLLAGLTLGSRDGAISQILYILGGALGLPFFAGVSGVAALIGPMGGYLIGFVFAAWAAGFLSRFAHSFAGIWAASFAASLLVLIPGVTVFRYTTSLSWSEAMVMGVVPFLIGDLVKVTLAAGSHSLRKHF